MIAVVIWITFLSVSNAHPNATSFNNTSIEVVVDLGLKNVVGVTHDDTLIILLLNSTNNKICENGEKFAYINGEGIHIEPITPHTTKYLINLGHIRCWSKDSKKVYLANPLDREVIDYYLLSNFDFR